MGGKLKARVRLFLEIQGMRGEPWMAARGSRAIELIERER